MAFRGLVHRIAAVVFVGLGLYSFFYLFFNKRGKQQLSKIFPLPEDTILLIKNISYHLGLVRERPDFDRYDYAEKAEFRALAWGAIVMIVTGFPLWFEDFFLRFMPIWLLDVFKSIHSYKAVLASSAVIA